MSDKLIVYYSRADENYVSGELKMLPVGNTEIAAGYIKELTGADVFKIEQKQPYSAGYNECIAQAQEDQKKDARPELVSMPESIDKYSEIYLCYPNYWGTVPMAVFTFLDNFSFEGKTIKPLCTHEGSGMGRSESDIKAHCKGAKVEKGLAIHGSSVKQSKSEIEKWI